MSTHDRDDDRDPPLGVACLWLIAFWVAFAIAVWSLVNYVS